MPTQQAGALRIFHNSEKCFVSSGAVEHPATREPVAMSNSSEDPISTLRTRATLLARVRRWEDAASWQEFDRLYRRLVYGIARRAGLPHAEAEDVTQDVFKCVAETIHQFEPQPGPGKFRGWLLRLTRWRIADKFNQRPKGEHQGSSGGSDGTMTRTPAIERVPDPTDSDAEFEREWQRHLLDAASERLSRRVKGRHYQAFDLYVRQRWPVMKVAGELRMNPATVYIIGFRLTKQLKAEVERLRAQVG